MADRKLKIKILTFITRIRLTEDRLDYTSLPCDILHFH